MYKYKINDYVLFEYKNTHGKHVIEKGTIVDKKCNKLANGFCLYYQIECPHSINRFHFIKEDTIISLLSRPQNYYGYDSSSRKRADLDKIHGVRTKDNSKKSCCEKPSVYLNVISNNLKFYVCSNCKTEQEKENPILTQEEIDRLWKVS